ncbi:NYN domain-containing protein [Nocardioides zhouii]|uniref:NYN domain-containing protein n=1 Tax=Nocardioides zhouii TaxID=1168729 RepID=UPI001A9249EF|nr:NYN domain-containing protein [Nocardioides zhouii]
MSSAPAALYLDFDNVFGGLLKLDPRVALRFAEAPSEWVGRLATELLTENERRWLVLRCYMNPAGWVPAPAGDGSRLYFSKFRPQFTDAGFEVIDCPRLTHTKNGADIRLVLDAAEALGASVRYDEFVIASGDSDMTPLLVRLRAADRRVTVLSPSDAAEVLGAISDRLVGEQNSPSYSTSASMTSLFGTFRQSRPKTPEPSTLRTLRSSTLTKPGLVSRTKSVSGMTTRPHR